MATREQPRTTSVPVPSSRWQGINRRAAVRQLSWFGALAGLASRTFDAFSDTLPLPEFTLFEANPERFWARVREEQFLLPDDRIFLNCGSVGVVPRPVLQAMIAAATDAAEYRTDHIVRWGYETLEPEMTELAEFLGCRKEELALTHNCTEAMSFIANGLDLKAGDEVLMTNQEHGGGSSCWRLKAARTGTVVREVELPTSPARPEELAERMLGAVGPRTRVLSFSGITSPTGMILPVREICQAAREKGLITVVDGAHMNGQVPLQLSDLGCDYFAGSPHKWLFAPAGCGLLYGQNDSLDRLWPCVATTGWDNQRELHATRFMMIGTNNRATVDGLMAGLHFLKRLGPERVYARTHQLAKSVRERVCERKYLEPITPSDARLYHAMVAFGCPKVNADALGAALHAQNINVISGSRFRVSTHIHTRPNDIEKLFEVCDRVLGA